MSRDRTEFPSRLALAGTAAVAVVASAAMFAPRFAALRAAVRDDLPDATTAEAPASARPDAPVAPPSSSALASGAARPPDPPLAPYVKLLAPGGACPAHMRLVEGVYCPNVGHVCDRAASVDGRTELGPDGKPICDDFGSSVLCDGRLERLRFCIDAFEYPNVPGTKPVRATSFRDAQRACATEGKRLCAVDEWAFACEGARMWPFPYGAKRDAAACNASGAAPAFTADSARDPARAALETERADGRAKSGERAACVSVFGVFDLPGNVAEWVAVLAPDGSKRVEAARAGGGWARGPAMCRTLERGALEPWGVVKKGMPKPERPKTPQGIAQAEARELARRVALAQTGFRCCADAAGSKPRKLLPETGRGKRPLDLRGTGPKP